MKPLLTTSFVSCRVPEERRSNHLWGAIAASDANPDKKTRAGIAASLLSVFNSATDADLGNFSKHLSGEAFDVQPVDKDADAIKTTIRGLKGLDKFLDTEVGLVRWHVRS